MKVYIGNKKIETDAYKIITEYKILEYLADDSECTEIIIDGVLRQLSIEEVEQCIALSVKKLRSSGSIKIVDIDFDLMTYAYKKLGNINNLNSSIFKNSSIKSFLTNDLVIDMFRNYPNVFPFRIEVQNIEFIMEFKKK
jgi:hypothetical protein